MRPLGSRRDQIVQEAAALFAKLGYRGTSMDDIAARVGMLKGSLYAHVANKEEILLEIMSTAARHFSQAIEPIAHGVEPAPVKLRRALHAHLGVIAAHRDMATVYLFEWRHLEGQPLRWFREAHGRYETLWQGIFEQGMAAGAFASTVDPRTTTLLLLSAANGACQLLDRHAGLDAETVVDRFSTLLLDGCGSIRP